MQPQAPADFTVIGKSAPRKDALAKVTGTAKYAGDIGCRACCTRCVLRPAGARRRRSRAWTPPAAERLPGVRVVRDGTWWPCSTSSPTWPRQALGLVKADVGRRRAAVDDQTHLRPPAADAPAAAGGGPAGRPGRRAKLRVRQVFEADVPQRLRGARADGDRTRRWPGRGRQGDGLGLHPGALPHPAPSRPGPGPRAREGARHHALRGRRLRRQELAGLQAVEAARLARLAGQPVQVAWGRAEEFFYDTFRPAAVVKIRSGLDGAGRIAFWDYQVYCAGRPGGRARSTTSRTSALPGHGGGSGGSAPGCTRSPTGAWRAPGPTPTSSPGSRRWTSWPPRPSVDPLEFRLRHLTDPRMLRVLQAAAERFGWTPGPAPQPGAAWAWPAALARAPAWPPWPRWRWTRPPGRSG